MNFLTYRHARRTQLPCLCLCLCLTVAHTGEPTTEDNVLGEVVVTAPYGMQIARDRVPARVQSATVADVESLQPQDLTALLDRGFGSVSLNQAQGNPLQPDVNFRGQTASPLLGLAQGISVYADGVRMNEAFGDTVNWDLLPLSAIHGVQLLAGSNPVFGLNSLGGALSLTMKNGFNTTDTSAEVLGGSFGRWSGSLQSGRNDGRWGWYGDIDSFQEDGWREFSHSDALRGYGALSWRNGDDRFDLAYSHADSRLRGNGAAPVELLAIDRRAVFTHPDVTDNHLDQLIATGTRALGADLALSGNAFYRRLRTDSFNGDATIFVDCADEAFLCPDDADTPVLDQHGDPVPAALNGAPLDAINNISQRNQHSYGGSVQIGQELDLGDTRRNNLTLGAAWQHGAARFVSAVEIAALTADRGTTRTGVLAEDFRTDVDSHAGTASLYAVDTYDLSTRLSLTASGRYDHTRVTIADRSGLAPELNGVHGFGRLNPAIGLAWRGNGGLLVFGSLSEASRAPTAVELACAAEDAPCSLPNAFLADPPLKEVVARSAEVGVQGLVMHGFSWQVGAFQTVNRHDILFQSTGGALANVGFFQNASDTRRRGLELSLTQDIGPVNWRLDYSLVDATYRDAFMVSSPNHPLVADDGKLLVEPGRQLPGVPRHQANLAVEWRASSLRAGLDLEYRSGVYLRGDEINALGRTHSYVVTNLHGEYRVSEHVALFARIENVFDTSYETFGVLGDPSEVFADFTDPRFFSAGAPRGAWLGVRLRF